ncbi:hypothetical protein P4S72_08705 [Vibrio sp. PP-XX7]
MDGEKKKFQKQPVKNWFSRQSLFVYHAIYGGIAVHTCHKISLFPSISVILFKRLLELKEADTDETIP